MRYRICVIACIYSCHFLWHWTPRMSASGTVIMCCVISFHMWLRNGQILIPRVMCITACKNWLLSWTTLIWSKQTQWHIITEMTHKNPDAHHPHLLCVNAESVSCPVHAQCFSHPLPLLSGIISSRCYSSVCVSSCHTEVSAGSRLQARSQSRASAQSTAGHCVCVDSAGNFNN